MDMSLHMVMGALARREGVGFSLDAYLASQADGLYFDFTKTDRHFQESTGPTLADDVGEAMGLILDSRTWGGKTLAQVLAEQTELLVPGSWSMTTDGGTAAATNSPAGTLNLTGDATNRGYGDQSITTVVGKTYRLEFTQGAGQVLFRIGTSLKGTQIVSSASSSGLNVYYFVATATTTWIDFNRLNAGTGSASAISVKLLPGNHGVQATGSLKPLRQTTGAKYDRSDDNHLTPYLLSGVDFVVALMTVPASISAFQAITGIGTADRFHIGFGTDGKVADAVGSDTTTFVGTTDWRGQEVVLGLTANGTTVRMFEAGSLTVEAAQTGISSTALPLRIGARNSGSAANFFGGSVKKIVAGREFLTLARYQQIRNALLAS